MPYQPLFTITPRLLSQVEAIAALREQIKGATIQLSWIPALQKDSQSRNAHASTAIEGNPLTLEQVKALAEGQERQALGTRSQREVLNYFAGLRHIEKRLTLFPLRHDDLFELHSILADSVMDQGEAGQYRSIAVHVGNHVPPPPNEVSGLMFELLDWWNHQAKELSPILSSAILHYRFETIHPFADGNGRAGRALALWELYRRGFDTHHNFSVDEYYWEDRPRYYAALESVRSHGEDLSNWLEYSAEGLHKTLEQVSLRIQSLKLGSAQTLPLRPKQEKLLQLLRDQGSMAPAEIWTALNISRQGAMDLLHPLMKAGLVEKSGSKKTGRYILSRQPSL